MVVKTRVFGKTKDGKNVTAFDMENGNGMFVTVLDLGATVQSVVVPDKNGNPVDVALGYEDVMSYENGSCFYGAVVGRYANRIKNARFVLDGKEYHLSKKRGRKPRSRHLQQKDV